MYTRILGLYILLHIPRNVYIRFGYYIELRSWTFTCIFDSLCKILSNVDPILCTMPRTLTLPETIPERTSSHVEHGSPHRETRKTHAAAHRGRTAANSEHVLGACAGSPQLADLDLCPERLRAI